MTDVPGWRRAASALRSFVAAVLCVLTGVLAAGGVIGAWARDQLLDTDRYLETVGPLVQSGAVLDDIARTVARAISDQVDLDGLVQALEDGVATLPPGTVLPDGAVAPDGGRLSSADAAAVAPEVQDALQASIEQTARDLTRSQEFGDLWVEVNRAGHTALVRLLEGDPRPVPGVVVEAGRVQLDLTPVVEAVRRRVEAAGVQVVGQIPPVRLVVDIADAAAVERARPVVAWLDRLGALAPYVVGASALLALVAARRRLTMVVWLALAVGLSMLLVWLALLYVRSAAIGELEVAGIPAGVAPVVVDQLTSQLRGTVRVVAGGAVVVGLLALAATALRSSGDPVTDRDIRADRAAP